MKYLILILATLFTPTLVFGAVADIDRIVFMSDDQTVLPDSFSKVLTIQTQNSSGAVETIDETADLSVTTTSPTGQFNSNNTAWNPNTTFTMSKNTGNKNFYYKDSVAGTYTITANLVTRATGQSWTTSQDIIISNEPPIVIPDTGGEVLGAATSTAATGTSASTHYIQESVSTYVEPANTFSVSAGRARLGYVGMPLHFVAKHKVSSDLKDKKCHYVWTFGDASSERGEEVDHTYKYSGDYNLVLNGECGSLKSVSRSTIKVDEMNLRVYSVSEDEIKIKNLGQNEINLYGLVLVNAKAEYHLPIDTIIDGHSEVIFPREYTGLSGGLGVGLKDDKGNMVVADEVMALVDFLQKIR